MSDTTRTILVAGLVALLVAGGLALFAKGPTERVIERVIERLGVSPGPDRFNSCESRDGVKQCFTRVALNAASTTACAIRSPEGTSTLIGFVARFSIASTTAKDVIIAKNSTNAGVVNDQNASTTVLGRGTIGASAAGTVMASTSEVTGNNILAPLSYVNISLLGGAGTDSPTGFCQATFEEI